MVADGSVSEKVSFQSMHWLSAYLGFVLPLCLQRVLEGLDLLLPGLAFGLEVLVGLGQLNQLAFQQRLTHTQHTYSALREGPCPRAHGFFMYTYTLALNWMN